MTFDDLVGHYEHYLAAVEPEVVGEANARLAGWLDDGDSTGISRPAGISRHSAGPACRRAPGMSLSGATLVRCPVISAR